MNMSLSPSSFKAAVLSFALVIGSLLALGCDAPVDVEGGELTPSSSMLGKADSGWKGSARPSFDESTCSYDREDPFEPRTRFTKGPWKGECLDTETRRPVQVLSSPDTKSPILELANVYHDKGYWFAWIPTDAVAQVYFQLEYFPAVVPAGHTQIRIEFSEPVMLWGQSQWNRGKEERIHNLVISAEAVPRVGDSYDLFKGMQDHFGLALRVTSLAARYESMIREQDHHVEQWILQLTETEKSELLPFYAHESEALGLEETYHTLFRNCTTELIRNLDGVVQYTVGENIKKFLMKATEFYPNIIRGALIARGLLPLDQSTDWVALEEDPTFAF